MQCIHSIKDADLFLFLEQTITLLLLLDGADVVDDRPNKSAQHINFTTYMDTYVRIHLYVQVYVSLMRSGVAYVLMHLQRDPPIHK